MSNTFERSLDHNDSVCRCNNNLRTTKQSAGTWSYNDVKVKIRDKVTTHSLSHDLLLANQVLYNYLITLRTLTEQPIQMIAKLLSHLSFDSQTLAVIQINIFFISTSVSASNIFFGGHYIYPKYLDRQVCINSVHPDQTLQNTTSYQNLHS